MSYDQSIEIWMWSNGISTAIALARLVLTVVYGVIAIRRGGNGINLLLLLLHTAIAWLLLLIPAAFLYAGWRAENAVRPPTATGQERVSEIAMILITLSVAMTFFNLATGFLEHLLYQALRKSREKSEKKARQAKRSIETNTEAVEANTVAVEANTEQKKVEGGAQG